MAIVKHIKSRNANYSAAINYLLFEHDEKTGKKIVDESGRSILRKEFYMDGLNCDPMSFDKECELTNAHFHKNKKREDIKSHHYIISNVNTSSQTIHKDIRVGQLVINTGRDRRLCPGPW